MDQFPSQSHASREPREIQPVVLTPGKIRKAPVGQRLRETFFQGNARDVWGAMFWEVFMSGIRDNVADAFHEGVDTLLRGQGGGGYRRSRSGIGRSNSNSRHNPDRALGGGGRGTDDRYSRDDRNRQNTSVIEIGSRAEAEEVLRAMNASLDQFDVVTLAEFYLLVKITPDHTDYKFGWEDLGGSRIAHSRGTYYLDLPPVITLK